MSSPCAAQSGAPQSGAAQSGMTHSAGAPAPAPVLSPDEIAAFAKVEVALGTVRDSAQFQLALAKNKTVHMQSELHTRYDSQVEEVLKHAGMTDAEYKRRVYLVSTNPEARKQFDAAVLKITGVPTPGQVPTVAGAVAAVQVPPGQVGVHIGHVMNSFGDTPALQGLLPVAMAEAKTAATHASLAARNPTNLDALKLHAGHILNAMDPTIVPMGPGLGYGMKKAALAVATHIELAAKAPGASPNVAMHSTHVAAAARSAAARADQVIDLAKQVQASTTAEQAAGLINQLVSLTAQLTTGADTNGDGKIGWQAPEGGLQQADEHVRLMLAGEGIKP